jgi:hypothetical protein
MSISVGTAYRRHPPHLAPTAWIPTTRLRSVSSFSVPDNRWSTSFFGRAGRSETSCGALPAQLSLAILLLQKTHANLDRSWWLHLGCKLSICSYARGHSFVKKRSCSDKQGPALYDSRQSGNAVAPFRQLNAVPQWPRLYAIRRLTDNRPTRTSSHHASTLSVLTEDPPACHVSEPRTCSAESALWVELCPWRIYPAIFILRTQVPGFLLESQPNILASQRTRCLVQVGSARRRPRSARRCWGCG